MSKPFLRFIKVVLVCLWVGYVAMAFILQDANPGNWAQGERAILMFWTALCAFMTSLIITD